MSLKNELISIFISALCIYTSVLSWPWLQTQFRLHTIRHAGLWVFLCCENLEWMPFLQFYEITMQYPCNIHAIYNRPTKMSPPYGLSSNIWLWSPECSPVGTVSGIIGASNGFKTSTKCLYKLYRPVIWDTMKFQMLPYEPQCWHFSE